MVTTRRSSENVNAYDNSSSQGGIQLLERPQARAEYAVKAPIKEKVNDSAKERMQKNLDRLLNYDRYSEQVEDVAVEEQNVQAPVAPVAEPVNSVLADEDIRPTSTTMQFGEDVEQIREEMNKMDTESEGSYKLNGKGKLAVILYSLAVAVILALIIINTGVLASLSGATSAKAELLRETEVKYYKLTEEIENISSSDYVINVAENEYGMVKR